MVQAGTFRPLNSTMGSRKEKKLFGFFNRGKKKKQALKSQDLISSDSEYPYSFDFNAIDYTKKILHCSWHPECKAVAVAGENNLFVYTES